MIGWLKGIVQRVGDESVILNVNGVGYELSATPRLLSRLAPGTSVEWSVETLVAETYIRLVGFETETERRTFRLLQTVQGVGAKAALSILHVLPPSELMDAIALSDKTAVARAQGVGPKLAQRVVTELKGKTGGLLGTDAFRPDPDAPARTGADVAAPARQDAIAALLSLGYDETAARRAVASVPRGEDENAQSLITAALKGLAPA